MRVGIARYPSRAVTTTVPAMAETERAAMAMRKTVMVVLLREGGWRRIPPHLHGTIAERSGQAHSPCLVV
ncbi:hypothetical protein CMS1908 [Clavibacter sepedonicus]|uniref:Uncharacterized protein n=1 Tax=Clavibacter sepedonicus TaxID=31964 RepID=B0RE48_CLASE|nr:hypothetical protein CMS1908 [Clavibacter sepedonicus]